MTAHNYIEVTKDALASIANGSEKVRCNNLVERIRKKTKLTNAETMLALKELKGKNYIECELYNGMPTTDVHINIPIPEKIKLKIEWQEAVDKQVFPGSTKRLRAKPIILAGRTHD